MWPYGLRESKAEKVTVSRKRLNASQYREIGLATRRPVSQSGISKSCYAEWKECDAACLDDLPDDALSGIFTHLGASGMALAGCCCRVLAAAALATATRIFMATFGCDSIPDAVIKPRMQFFALVDRARSNLETHRQETFFWAVANGYSAYVKNVLNAEGVLRGRILNFRNADGISPLFLATRNNHLPIARLLIDYTAEVNPPNLKKLPLLQACRVSNAKCVHLLLDAKADPIARRTPLPEGVISPLQAAIQSNSNALECVGHICASLNEEQRQSCCARMAFLHACELGDIGLVKLMAEERVGIRAPPEDIWRHRGSNRFDGTTPLLIAAQAGHNSLAEFLLDAKVAGNINAVLATNKTALYISAEKGNAILAKKLLSKFASLDIQTCTGRSALFAAVEHCHDETVQVMSEYIDVRHITKRTKGEEGVSPFMLAEKRGKTCLIVPMLEAYHRAVERRKMLRSFGDVIDDVTHPYLSKKVDQYRGVMFQHRDEVSSPSQDASPSRLRQQINRMETNDRLKSSMEPIVDRLGSSFSSPRRTAARPASAPRVLSKSLQNSLTTADRRLQSRERRKSRTPTFRKPPDSKLQPHVSNSKPRPIVEESATPIFFQKDERRHVIPNTISNMLPVKLDAPNPWSNAQVTADAEDMYDSD